MIPERVKLQSFNWMLYIWPEVTNTVKITLSDNVDVEALKKAAQTTVKIHPLINYGVEEDSNGDVYMKKLEDEFPVEKFTDGIPSPIGGKSSKGRFFGISYCDNVIFIAYFHALTDGVGRNRVFETLLYYYFTYKNNKQYEPGNIWIDDGNLHEGQFQDILELNLDVDPDFKPLPFDPNADIFEFPEVSMDKLSGQKSSRYKFSVKSDDLMAYAKANGHTPTISLELLINKALVKLYPENIKPIRTCIPCSLRKQLGNADIFRDGITTLFQDMSVEEINQPEDIVGKAKRAELKALMDTNNLKLGVQGAKKLYEYGLTETTAAGKTKVFAPVLAGMKNSYNITYIGTIQKTDYSDEIKDVVFNSVGGATPVFTMVDINGYFEISLLQTFDDPKYFEAVCEQFEEHGIKVHNKGTIPNGGFGVSEHKSYLGWK